MGPGNSTVKFLAGEILENGDQKTLIYRELKIRNGILYRGESAMGKVSSATLSALFLTI
jgi:hypothetical protein